MLTPDATTRGDSLQGFLRNMIKFFDAWQHREAVPSATA
jgi:hypothetical protein